MIPLASAERAHAGDRIGHPLTTWDAAVARCLLATVHRIEVRVETVGDVVHLYPQQPVTTAQEVLVLRQFIEFTDAPINWHRPKDLVWT